MANVKAVQGYLFVYNAVQVVGWSVILVKTVLGILSGKSNEQLYNSVELPLQIFQTAAVLEVVHAVVGLVRSPVGTTAVQVWSRVTLVWLVLFKVVSSRSSIGVPLMLLAWSITEVIRYSFYALGLFNMTPYIITWMRYTFFIVLYPAGVTGELLTMVAALPEIARKKHFALEMPNSVNMGFSFYYMLIVMMLIYLPGFPKLYFYMFGQRKKVLTVEPSKKKQ